ncbi:MAG: hypothetical protein ACYC69_01645 [Thermodesulfovibrionales bacterium]
MAEREFGTEIVIVKKTSPDYHPEKDPPCPSVLLDARVLVANGTITFETLQSEIRRER